MADPLKNVWIQDVPLTQGVINRFQSRRIPDGAAEELLNVDLTDPSRPKVRDGYVEVGAGGAGIVDGTKRVAGLGYLDNGPSARLLVAAVSDSDVGAVYGIANPDSTLGWSKATTAEGASLNVDTDTPKMLQANELLVIVPGPAREVHFMDSTLRLYPGGSQGQSPPRGVVDAAWMFQRVWLLSGDAVYWSKLRPVASDVDEETAFDRTLQALQLGSTAAGQPVALAPWTGTSLIVYYERAILEVVVNNADPSQSAVRVLEPRIGCGARDSIVTLGQEQYFLDQYGQYRSLTQTITGAQQGIRAEPLSELIYRDLPARLNRAQLSKVRAELLDDKVYLFVPRDTSAEAQHCWVFDTVRRSWIGPWEFNDPISSVVVSDIRGNGLEMYAANGNSASPETRIYRMFPGNYSDNGQAITYRETSRCNDLGAPQHKKTPQFVEVELAGSIGAKATISLRTSEADEFTAVDEQTISANADASLPLAEGSSDFPLIEAGEAGTQFPLTEATAQPLLAGTKLHESQVGDFPLYESQFPAYSEQFPLYGAHGGPAAGRFIQYRIEASLNGLEFERSAIRIGVLVDEIDTTGEAA